MNYFVSDLVASISKIGSWWCWVQHTQTPQNSVSGLWYRQSLKDTLKEEEVDIITCWTTWKLLKTTLPTLICRGTHARTVVCPAYIQYTFIHTGCWSSTKHSSMYSIHTVHTVVCIASTQISLEQIISALVFKRQHTDNIQPTRELEI